MMIPQTFPLVIETVGTEANRQYHVIGWLVRVGDDQHVPVVVPLGTPSAATYALPSRAQWRIVSSNGAKVPGVPTEHQRIADNDPGHNPFTCWLCIRDAPEAA